jgi:hypothetical protein
MSNNIISITAVPPDVPTLTSVTFTNLDGDLDASLPTYTTATISAAGVLGTTSNFNDFFESGSLNPFDDSDPTALSVTAVPPDIPTTGASLPTYEVSSFSVGSGTIDDEIAKMLTYIETDEDVELANAKAAEITLRLRRALEKFNADIAEYKTENEGELQRYQAEVQAYQAEVNEQVQEYAQKISRYQLEVNTIYQAWNVSHQAAIQESLQELQVENQVNIAEAQGELQKNIDNENRSQQRQLQNSVNDMQAIVANNDDLMGKYTTEITEYQAEVNTEIQEKTIKVQQYKALHDQLLLDYNSAFGVPGAEA